MGILGILLPALIPSVADGIGSLFKHFFGGKGEPQTVEDRVKINESEGKRDEGRAKLLSAETFTDQSAWAQKVDLAGRGFVTAVVVYLTLVPRALRELTRPALAWLAVCGGFYLAAINNPHAVIALELAGQVYSLYFGGRLHQYIKNGK